MRGLYAIVDVSSATARGLDPLAFAMALLDARPTALQLRAKELPPREILALLRALVPVCRTARVPLVTNDHADLAALAGSEFVHVGQGDMPPAHVRRIAPGVRVGVSTHSLEQLARALEARPDYVAFGPVFPTGSKANPDPVVGLDGLAAAATLASRSGVPLVAIGGITLARAPSVAPFAAAAAAIAALYTERPHDAAVVASHARALHAALGAEGARRELGATA